LSASSSVTIVVNPAAATTSSAAQFLKTDTATKGNWKGVYGANGFNVIEDTVSYPAYAAVTQSGATGHIWQSSTTDSRALERDLKKGRIAAAWLGSSFTIDVNLIDQATHQVALYCVDWDSRNRSQRIDVLDAVSGAILDTQTVTSFAKLPQYLVWSVTGHVKLRVTLLGGPNSVVSGIFF